MTRRRQKLQREAFMRNNPDLFAIADEGDTAAPLAPLTDEAVSRPEQLRFISFGSGRSGNCAYIGTPSCGLLLDAGVDNNTLLAELASNSINPLSIAGILLTHDHSDHVRFAYAILRRHSISRRINDYHQPIYKEFPFKVGPFTITAFETSHDGTDNSGFCIQGLDTTFVLATDTGTVTSRMDFYVRQADHLMIEADYDAEMLRNGPYPERLKARIASTIGHMGNDDTARYLASVAAAGRLRSVFLCHLSHINNTPNIALRAVRTALEEAGVKVAGADAPSSDPRLRLAVLPRLESSLLSVLGRPLTIRP